MMKRGKKPLEMDFISTVPFAVNNAPALPNLVTVSAGKLCLGNDL